MRFCGVLLAFFIMVLAIYVRLPSPDRITLSSPSDDNGRTWVILIAGSPGYHNYAMQSDICNAFQMLVKGGMKKEHIVVFMPDDIANHPNNFKPGTILNKRTGYDVYGGVAKDYTGDNMTIHNFFAVLTGSRKRLRGGSGKILLTKPKDRIFLFYSGPEFGYEELHSHMLLKTIQKVYLRKQYKSMVICVATCYGGSMFSNYSDEYKRMNVYALTSSNDKENSYQMPKNNGVNFGTKFGYHWIKDSEKYRGTKRTFEEQYKKVKHVLSDSNEQSTVTQYGDTSISNHELRLYH